MCIHSGYLVCARASWPSTLCILRGEGDVKQLDKKGGGHKFPMEFACFFSYLSEKISLSKYKETIIFEYR